MVCEGGEIAFVTRIISESLIHRERVQWYTSMLGKFSSVPIIVSHLKEAGVGNWAVTEFVQGSKTRRWAVGWSFGDLRPVGRVARGVASLEKQFLPFPPEYGVVVCPRFGFWNLDSRVWNEGTRVC
jgi:23S rRNA (adenine1618-N6)-methyltransferase